MNPEADSLIASMVAWLLISTQVISNFLKQLVVSIRI
jgi:hypothetical protein